MKKALQNITLVVLKTAIDVTREIWELRKSTWSIVGMYLALGLVTLVVLSFLWLGSALVNLYREVKPVLEIVGYVVFGLLPIFAAWSVRQSWKITHPKQPGNESREEGGNSSTAKTKKAKVAEPKIHRVLGYTLGILILLVLGITQVKWIVEFLDRMHLRNVVTQASAISPKVYPDRPPHSEEGEEVATEFWRAEGNDLSPEDADQMIEIARKESGFNQFELDGTTPLEARGTTRAIGIMQIDVDSWGDYAKLLGHDIATREGNLKMALWIRKKCGADEWTTSGLTKDVCPEGIPLVAPIGKGWSEKIFTDGIFWRWKASREDAKFVFLVNEGLPDEREVRLNTKDPKLDGTKSVRFRSDLDEEIALTIFLNK